MIESFTRYAEKERNIIDTIDVLEKYIAATNTHDFDNVANILHPEAVYYFSDSTCRTSAEIRDYFEKAWQTVADEVYSATDIEWLVRSADTAVCVYRYHYEGYVDGSFVSGTGRATNVFVSSGVADNWLLIHEHLSN